MNLVDSCGWLEYFADGPNAHFFMPPIEDTEHLIVPAISIFEVFKRVFQQRGEDAALQAAALMHQGQLVVLDERVAMHGAKHRIDHKLPLADSIVLATAHLYEALLWTQDSDFAEIAGVKYVEEG